MSEHTDQRIDEVLTALRDTESPIGLEARIASYIAGAAEARAGNTSRFGAVLNAVTKSRAVFAGVPLYAFAGATLALLLATFSIVRVSHRSLHTVAQTRPLAVPAKPHTPAEQFALARIHPSAQALPDRHPQHAQSLSPSPTALTDPDAVALAETLAPSHPAPPMPLTEQERLMLNVLNSGDQEEIAALDPVERDALFAQDQTAFHYFFAPPTPSSTTGDKE